MFSALKRFLPSKVLVPLLLVGALLCVVGARWSLIHRYGSDVPFMDQWDAEAERVIIPANQGNLSWADLVVPHNEHRIVLTKLTALGLTKVDGQWSPLLEMTLNAVIFAGALGTLLLFARKALSPLLLAAFCAFCALLFSLPYDWENTLAGFQSQFYYLVWTSLLGLWLCLTAPSLGRRWWAGFVVLTLGLGTMSSGMLAAMAAGGALVLQGLLSRRWSRRDSVALGLLILLTLTGLALSTHVVGHDVLRAASPAEFARSLLSCLAWPERGNYSWALLFALPPFALLASCVWRRKLELLDAALLGMHLCFWLQMAALSYARGHAEPPGSPRYTDIIAVGLLLNALSLGRSWAGVLDKLRPLVLIGWSLAVVLRLLALNEPNEAYLRGGFTMEREAEKKIFRDYARTGDPEVILRERKGYLPHPSPETILRILEHPAMKSALPPSLLPGVKLEPAKISEGFTRGPAPQAERKPDAEAWTALRGPARFLSAPLPREHAFLRIQFLGDKGLSPKCISLVTEDGQTEPLEVERFSGERWQSAQLSLPSGKSPLRLRVELPSGEHWLSFTEPLPLGRLSWLSHHLLKRADFVFWTGISLLSLATLALVGVQGPGSKVWQHLKHWALGLWELVPKTLFTKKAAKLLGLEAALLALAHLDKIPGAGTSLPTSLLLLGRLGSLLAVLFPLALLANAAALRLRRKPYFPDSLSLALASLGLVCLLAYGVFWCFFASAWLGQAVALLLFVWALADCAQEGWIWSKPAKDQDGRIAMLLLFGVALTYFGLMHLQWINLRWGQMSAFRFEANLPVDNEIPQIFAERLLQGQSPKNLIGDWLSSDRPPLQTGFILLLAPLRLIPGINFDSIAQAAGMLMQLLWVPAAYGLLRVLGLRSRNAALCLLPLLPSAFLIVNSTYVWPKLAGAGLLLSGWLFLKKSESRFGPREALIVGLFFGLSYLSHGGGAFTLLALAPLLLLFRPRLGLRSILAMALGFFCLSLPWAAYQNLYEPPGNRLLKWHLGGSIPPDNRGTGEVLKEAYASAPLSKHLEVKWHNFKSTFSGHYEELLNFSTSNIQTRIPEDFFFSFRSIGWWNSGILLSPLALWLCWRRPSKREFSARRESLFGIEVLVWSALAHVLWCALMFLPNSTLIHQGPYVHMVSLFCLSAWTLWSLHPLLFLAVALPALAYSLTLYGLAKPLLQASEFCPLALLPLAAAALVFWQISKVKTNE